MYRFNRTNHFKRKYKKLAYRNSILNKAVTNALVRLASDPFDLSLRTHRVISVLGQSAWSSMVSGDIRIIWEFNGIDLSFINLIDIGGHSGKRRVYR